MYYTQLEVVKLLVESGANVNHRDSLGATVLFWATGKISIYLSMCNVHISFFLSKGFLGWVYCSVFLGLFLFTSVIKPVCKLTDKREGVKISGYV